MNIEERIHNSLAEEIQKTVDYDVLCDVMVRFGWTVVEVKYFSGDGDTLHRWVDVMKWVDANCTGQHKEHLGKWLFEIEKDATMFSLRWA